MSDHCQNHSQNDVIPPVYRIFCTNRTNSVQNCFYYFFLASFCFTVLRYTLTPNVLHKKMDFQLIHDCIKHLNRGVLYMQRQMAMDTYNFFSGYVQSRAEIILGCEIARCMHKLQYLALKILQW